MSFKVKTLGVLASGMFALGIVVPALAEAPSDSHDTSFTINSTNEFSVEIVCSDYDTFTSVDFDLDGVESANAALDVGVTDLRGTGDGWNASFSSTGFQKNNVFVAGAKIWPGNNTPWVSDPSCDNVSEANADGFVSIPNSVRNGVTANFSTWGADFIASPVSILTAASGSVANEGIYPNGTGVFYTEQALYLSFPPAVGAGTYTANVVVTLTSDDI